MKKIFFLVVTLTLFVAPSAIAQEAVTSSPSASPNSTVRKSTSEDRLQLLKSVREQAQKKREEFKANLKRNITAIQDTKKQAVVENINERISNRNDTWVTHWNEVITRLTSILDKTQTRATALGSSGKDISAVNSAITSARAAIDTAQSKVDTQEGKTYEFKFDSEETLGANVRLALSTFQTDVKSVIASLNEARRAVAAAVTELKKIST